MFENKLFRGKCPEFASFCKKKGNNVPISWHNNPAFAIVVGKNTIAKCRLGNQTRENTPKTNGQKCRTTVRKEASPKKSPNSHFGFLKTFYSQIIFLSFEDLGKKSLSLKKIVWFHIKSCQFFFSKDAIPDKKNQKSLERVLDLGFPTGWMLGFLVTFLMVLNKIFWWYFPGSTFIRSIMSPPKIPNTNTALRKRNRQ